MALKTRVEFFEVRRSARRARLCRGCRHFAIKFEAAKLAHIVVDQCAVFEMKNCASILAAVGVPQEACPSSPGVYRERPVQFEEDLLAMAADCLDHRACQTGIVSAKPLRVTRFEVTSTARIFGLSLDGEWSGLLFRLQVVLATLALVRLHEWHIPIMLVDEGETGNC